MSSRQSAIPYFIGSSLRQVPQIIGGVQRLVEVPVHVVQGKVVWVSDIKHARDGADYCVARVAGGAQGFALVKGFHDIAHELAALPKGAIITCDGKYRPTSVFNAYAGGTVLDRWFTARTVTVLRPPAPVAEPEWDNSGDFDMPPL